MDRRGFFGAFAKTAIGVAIPAAIVAQEPKPTAVRYSSGTAIPVARANGSQFIVGVATETVHAGDFVQIQTHGPVHTHAICTSHSHTHGGHGM